MRMALAAGLLAACVAAPCSVTARAQPNLPAGTSSKSPDQSRVTGGRIIDTVIAGRTTRYWQSLNKRATAAKMDDIFAVEGQPGAPPPEVTAVVNEIWKRLLAASPVPGDPTVYVADCGADAAESILPGATRICWGFLRDLKTEDEVAAVLGHEMAHLILGHVDTARSRGTGFGVLQGLFDVAFVAGTLAGGGVGMYASLVGGNDALAIPTGWLDRANQKEELTADRLGIDLLVKAGFNGGALSTVFAIDGKTCGAAKVRNSPKLALMIDTSTRFTHPEDGRRACEAQAYVNRFYADAYDRAVTPLPWAERKAGAAGTAFFTDVEEADRLILQARSLRARLAKAPNDRAARSSCVTLQSRARSIADRHPDDRDLRRFVSATALACGNPDGAFDALIEEVAPTQRTKPGQFQALAISALKRDPGTAELFSRWIRLDFNQKLRNQKPSLLSVIGLKSDAVDVKGEYETFTCILGIPELTQTYDRFCNELFAGTAAAYTCSHKYDVPGTCASTRYFPNAKPIGPREFLISQSRWYATALVN